MVVAMFGGGGSCGIDDGSGHLVVVAIIMVSMMVGAMVTEASTACLHCLWL